MSKTDPSSMKRSTNPVTSSSTSTNTESENDTPVNKQNKKPKINSKAVPEAIENYEEDGAILRGRTKSSDDSSEETEPKWWKQRFREEMKRYEVISDRNRQRAEAKAATPKEKSGPTSENSKKNSPGIVRAPAHSVSVRNINPYATSTTTNSATTTTSASTSTSPTTSTEPRLARKPTFRQKMRQSMSNLPRLSISNVSELGATLTDLVRSPWRIKTPISSRGDEILQSDNLSLKVRNAMANEINRLTSDIKISTLPLEEREEQIKLAIAKKFLSLALGDEGDFDQSKMDSVPDINRYLSKTYGFVIEWPPVSPKAEESLTQRARSSSTLIPEIAADYRDALLEDALNCARRNYHVSHEIDLSNLDKDPFIRGVYDGTIGGPQRKETVTVQSKQRTDVTPTFYRDFEHSTYQIEAADNSMQLVDSIDKFVEFVGDPQNCGLPRKVSHFANQNIGIFIKNILFTRTDENGERQSPIKLFDGTPVRITMSPKARYRFKKVADGSVILSYQATFETKGAKAENKNTASLSLGKDQGEKAVLIENAQATITLDLTFKTDGTVTMGKLNLNAAGWNTTDA